MGDTKRKILVLVEGAKTDYKLMQKLFATYGISERYEIIPYRTNIYTLYKEMFRDHDPSSIDTLQNLKAHEPDPEIKKLFDIRYSDILLIFDLDPQDPLYSPDKIAQMAEYFCESSDMGKLYLNYPMVEAFYHMKSIPDPAYDTYMASLEELRNHGYKSRVTAENRNHDYGKFAVTKQECTSVIWQNIEKARRLIQSSTEDGRTPDTLKIWESQLQLLEDMEQIAVLCGCCFYIYDYNPALLEA